MLHCPGDQSLCKSIPQFYIYKPGFSWNFHQQQYNHQLGFIHFQHTKYTKFHVYPLNLLHLEFLMFSCDLSSEKIKEILLLKLLNFYQAKIYCRFKTFYLALLFSWVFTLFTKFPILILYHRNSPRLDILYDQLFVQSNMK